MGPWYTTAFFTPSYLAKKVSLSRLPQNYMIRYKNSGAIAMVAKKVAIEVPV